MKKPQKPSDSIKNANIRIIGVPEEDREMGTEFKEIIAENFPNLGKELNIQIHEANRTSYLPQCKKTFPRHIAMKPSKVNNKEIISHRQQRKKEITYKVTTIKLAAHFSAETLQTRKK